MIYITHKSTTHPFMRIRRGDHFALILKDAPDHSHFWHWIVQRKGSSEVLGLGKAKSKQDAVQAAERCLDGLLVSPTF